jgi:hypothetical protein
MRFVIPPSGDAFSEGFDAPQNRRAAAGLSKDEFDGDDFDNETEGEFDALDDDVDDVDDSSDDDDDLDEEFPLGDGVADLAAQVFCPYCGEPVEITLDPGSGSHQEYIEDCQVCCQPWRVSVTYQEDGHADVSVNPEDES